MFRFRETLSGEEASKQDKIEAKFKKFCKDVKSKENRFCYYLGGTEDAATGWAKNAWAKAQNTYFPRDEIGLMCLPTQLERILQLYW